MRQTHNQNINNKGLPFSRQDLFQCAVICQFNGTDIFEYLCSWPWWHELHIFIATIAPIWYDMAWNMWLQNVLYSPFLTFNRILNIGYCIIEYIITQVWNDSGYVNLTQWWYFFIIFEYILHISMPHIMIFCFPLPYFPLSTSALFFA